MGAAVSFCISAATSVACASSAISAPSDLASSSLSGCTSTAATCMPIALAYWTAMWPRPPIPETTTHSPGLTSVSLSPCRRLRRRTGSEQRTPFEIVRQATDVVGSASAYSAKLPFTE